MIMLRYILFLPLGYMPPKDDKISKQEDISNGENKLTFAPKVPARRRKVEGTEQANVDILSGPKIKPGRTETERPKRERVEQPVKVAFQAPAVKTVSRSQQSQSAYSSLSISDNLVFAAPKAIDTMKDENISSYDLSPQNLPFPYKENKDWYDGNGREEPESLPAYKDPSLPNVIEQLKQLSIEKEEMTDEVQQLRQIDNQNVRNQIRKGEYPHLSGHGDVLPFQSAADWFYPPKFEKRKIKDPFEIKQEIKLNDDGQREELKNTTSNVVPESEYFLFQLPSHLPTDTIKKNMSPGQSSPFITQTTMYNNSNYASSANSSFSNLSMASINSNSPYSESVASGVYNNVTVNEYDIALLHDEPLIIDDATRSGASVGQLSKQYKVFSTNDDNTIKNIPSGQIGEIVVYRSGKVKMRIGNVLYDVSSGVHSLCHEDLASITSTNDNEIGDSNISQFTEVKKESNINSAPKDEDSLNENIKFYYSNLGSIEKHVVVSLDVDSLLKQKKQERIYVPIK